ncbi:MAG: transporter [Simkania sp.]|nr:transporter [Simkania sp.]
MGNILFFVAKITTPALEMKKKLPFALLILLLLTTSFIHAQPTPQSSSYPYPSPSDIPKIEQELAQAQKDFEIAKKMFNPYYAGPLLTPSAHNVPPGHFNIQPYIFFTCTFAEFNNNRRSVNITDNWQLKGSFIFQMGLFNWLDFTATFNGQENWQGNQSSGNWGDTQVEFGIQLMREQPYRPALRLTITENIPTGKYEKLNPAKAGIQATGSGSYSTTLSFNITKVIWWVSTHPFSFRASFNYTIPTLVYVQGFNAYGGGFGTHGKVRPGNSIAIDTSIELSFTQHWVLAIDLVYTYQNHSTFSGHKGRTATGAVASVGGPSNDSLSCAPAIEYNPTENMGFLAGAWFSITGRNSGDFIAAVLTMTYFW